MQLVTLHEQFRTIAKQGGVMPSYWSAIETSLSCNDRLPSLGFLGDSV